MQAGYSGTPLAKKLGIKDDFVVKIINEPNDYYTLIDRELPQLNIARDETVKKDFIHFFSKEMTELEEALPKLREEIKSNGMIWISWPKKASKVPTDITEDAIRTLALGVGLVDVKVCAIDQTWSGLKLVIPLNERK